jgi:hypothetical protein
MDQYPSVPDRPRHVPSVPSERPLSIDPPFTRPSEAGLRGPEPPQPDRDPADRTALDGLASVVAQDRNGQPPPAPPTTEFTPPAHRHPRPVPASATAIPDPTPTISNPEGSLSVESQPDKPTEPADIPYTTHDPLRQPDAVLAQKGELSPVQRLIGTTRSDSTLTQRLTTKLRDILPEGQTAVPPVKLHLLLGPHGHAGNFEKLPGVVKAEKAKVYCAEAIKGDDWVASFQSLAKGQYR